MSGLPAILRTAARRMIDALHLDRGATVLDVTGDGGSAAALAMRRGATVVSSGAPAADAAYAIWRPEIEGALRNAAAALVPGAPIAVLAVDRAGSTFYSRAAEAIGVEEPAGPGPEEIVTLLEGCGFAGVALERFAVSIRVPGATEHLKALVDPRLEREDLRAAATSKLEARLELERTPSGIELFVEVVLATARAPGPPRRATLDAIIRDAAARTPSLSVEDARALIEGGGIAIDVRQEGEVDRAILGAVNVPRGVLEQRIEELVPDPRTPILLYCADGRQSALAAQALAAGGYRAVAILSGGIARWRDP
jgi:rhodanese-related sulfurtransferase